jgi:hypothetical protein
VFLVRLAYAYQGRIREIQSTSDLQSKFEGLYQGKNLLGEGLNGRVYKVGAILEYCLWIGQRSVDQHGSQSNILGFDSNSSSP